MNRETPRTSAGQGLSKGLGAGDPRHHRGNASQPTGSQPDGQELRALARLSPLQEVGSPVDTEELAQRFNESVQMINAIRAALTEGV